MDGGFLNDHPSLVDDIGEQNVSDFIRGKHNIF